MSHLHSGSSFISQPVQAELDGKVALVSATKQTIGSALDVSGNINLPTGESIQNPQPSTCVIKPIRNETTLTGFLQLYYNPTTGELVYN